MPKVIDIDEHETKDAPLWFHKRGLQQTASGFGKKLTTRRKIFYQNRWYRIYCGIFSNCGTTYIISKGEEIVVR